MIEKDPWAIENCPHDIVDKEKWAKDCEKWCTRLFNMKKYEDYWLRDHLECPQCSFGYVLRTSNYSMRSSSDVKNNGVCCNPVCKHRWEETS